MAWTKRSRSGGLTASLLLLIGSAPACGTRALDLGGGGAGGTAGLGGSSGAGGTVGNGGATGGVPSGAAGATGAAGVGGAPSQPCARESDCPSGMVCGYPIRGGCDAQGVCVPRWPPPGGPACLALLELCGCEGGFVIAGCNYAGGYAPAPTVPDYAPCADASTDPAPGRCHAWGQTCGAGGMCCDGLGCSPSGSTGLPGSCVPL